MAKAWGIFGPFGDEPPKSFTAITVAAGLLVLAAVVRLIIDRFVPGVPPFFLLFPVVMLATLGGGWRLGLVVMSVGGVYAWWQVLDHPFLGGGSPWRASDLVSLGLYLISAAGIVALAQAFRVSMGRQRAAASRRLDEQDQILEHARGLMAVVSGPDYVFDFANEAYRRLVGQHELAGLPLKTAIPDFPQSLIDLLDDVRRTGLGYSAHGMRVGFPGRGGPAEGGYRYLDFILQPMLAADGQVARIYFEGSDVTRRVRGEHSLRDSQVSLERAAAAGHLAIWHFDPSAGLVHSPELNAIFGVSPDVKLTGDDVRSFYAPGELERIRTLSYAAYARGERHMEIEARIRRTDGEERWVMLRGEMEANAEGHPRAVMGFTMDITERKQVEDRRALLAQEVNHRANNLLAVVQGAVQFSKAPTPDSLKTVLLGRIAALGHAHQLLSPDRWEVANLRDLAEEELAAFGYDDSQRIVITGPATPLGGSVAQALALALHELATNATKYGALSVLGGQVKVSWQKPKRGPLTLTWRETGGPVVSPPTRRGQGVTLLEVALAGSLNGKCQLDWRPEGLLCVLSLPAESVRPAAAAGA